MLPKLTIVLCLLCSICFLQAQENNSSDWEFTPSLRFDGLLKTKYEYAEKTNMSRFSVCKSRVAISGDITNFVTYRAQLELSSYGKLEALDLYSAINPIEGLIIKIGQSSVALHNPYITNPGLLMFANRAFIGKFFTPDGSRDLGVSASYNFKLNNFPLGIDAGVFNGNTINAPVWTNSPSYTGRIRIGDMQGFRTTAKMYKLPKNELINYMFYGFDLRYEADNWKVETEIMHRKNKVDNHKLLSTYLQGAYWFPIHNVKLFKNIIPAARWDSMGSSQTNDDFDVHRLTLGLGFSFTSAPFESLIRIDYESYFTKNELTLFNVSEEMNSNKLSIEVLLTF